MGGGGLAERRAAVECIFFFRRMGAGETHTVRKHFGLEIGCLVVAGKHCKKIRAKAVVVLVSFPIITPVVGKRGKRSA